MLSRQFMCGDPRTPKFVCAWEFQLARLFVGLEKFQQAVQVGWQGEFSQFCFSNPAFHFCFRAFQMFFCCISLDLGLFVYNLETSSMQLVSFKICFYAFNYNCSGRLLFHLF